MGARFPSVFTSTTGVATGSGGEVVAATTPPLTLPYDGASVFIAWQLVIPHGAAAITPAFNVRRGATVASTLVLGTATLTAPANNAVVLYSGTVVDTNPGASQPQYSIAINNVNSGTSVVMSAIIITAYAL
jgi:hypothetical protein